MLKTKVAGFLQKARVDAGLAARGTASAPKSPRETAQKSRVRELLDAKPSSAG
jgi:hypothetical protein